MTAAWLFALLSARRRAEEALRNSKDQLSSVYEAVGDVIFQLSVEGEDIYRFVSVNQPFLTATGLSREAVLGKLMNEVIPEPSRQIVLEKYREAIATGYIVHWEETSDYPSGRLTGEVSVVPVFNAAGNCTHLVGSVHDITQRKQAQEALRASEERLRLSTELAEVAVWEYSFITNSMSRSKNHDKLYGLDWQKKWDINTFLNATHPDDRAYSTERIQRSAAPGGPDQYTFDFRVIYPDQSVHWLTVIGQVVERNSEGQGTTVRGALIDINKRKQAEQALEESRSQLQGIITSAMDAVITIDEDQRIILFNPAAERMYKCPASEVIGQSLTRFMPEYVRDSHRQFVREFGRSNESKRSMKTPSLELTCIRANGEEFPSEVSISQLELGGQKLYTAIVRDITERKAAEEKIKRQVEHISALREIDRTIISSFDLRVSMEILLTQVSQQLGVDAVRVLLLNPGSQMLEFTAGRGFRTHAFDHVQLRLGESYAGRAVLERQMVHITNLKNPPDKFGHAALLPGDDFVCYYGMPLISKGKVKGVLEIFHRSPLEPGQEWLDFLDTLAGQAAIAVDNAALFENLQRSNLDLRLAYDATIVGWSHALDLRDKETEGHAQRVVEMAVELARAFGLSDEELIYVRWGGLLHDIGKMGIPDHILLKPGPLTDEEWVVMKKHPEFAYDMLSPIRYLKSAIDIPYCHHEKWDGTGYPRGLKGEQIPLTARIFAVVDVWDAITSDRPYRPAWTKEKALEHIKSLAGSHFDERVVQAFLDLKSVK